MQGCSLSTQEEQIMNQEHDLSNHMRAITISREYGSGGGEIASRLARRLVWDLIDHAIVERTARELGTSIQEAEAHDEHTQGLVSRALSSILYLDPALIANVPPAARLSDEEYLEIVNRIIRAAAARGHVVIVGRASQVILAPLRDVLHVRIIAPFEQRVAYVMQREGVDRHTAESRIHRKDHERASYLKQEYHHQPGEAHLYDLVLNTSLLDLESAVDVICLILQRKARRLAVKTGDLGSAAGLSRYPAQPEDFHSLAH
jgi:cytidylate kinase